MPRSFRSWFPGVLYRVGAAVAATGLLGGIAWVSTSLLIVVLAVILVIYAVFVFWAARFRVDGSPRVPMHICDRHGPMPIGATIVLFDEMDHEVEGRTKRGPIRVCPLCFEKSIKVAKENLAKGK